MILLRTTLFRNFSMDWSSTLALAGQAADAAATAEKPGNPYGMLPVIVIIMGLFYFLVIRPQKKGQKQVEEMRNTVKKGDRVKSIGGIYGTVTAVDTTNNIVSVQVDTKVKLDFDKDAIATVVRKEDVKQMRDTGKQAQIAEDPETVVVEPSK